MALDGTTLEKIRERLIDCGVEATRESIQRAMHGDDTALDRIVKDHGDDSLRGIDGPLFDDFRGIVDDFILEGRTPERVRAYLMIEGFSITTEVLASYMTERKSVIDGPALDVAQRNHHVHTRTLKRHLVEIWHNMPPDKRYTERMFGVVLSEYGAAVRYEIDNLLKTRPGGETIDAANAELERKLGIAEKDEPGPDEPGQDEPSADASSVEVPAS